jgi:putative oxidoreductase
LIKKIIVSPYTALVGRILLGAIFIFASFYKILHPDAFVQTVMGYKLLPLFMVNLFALILPWMELISGIFLLFGLLTRGSIFIINLLIIMFLFALASALVRGIDMGCGCFPPWIEQKITIRILLRDAIIFFVALQVFFCDRKVWSLDKLIRRSVQSSK